MCGIFGFFLNRPLDESEIKNGIAATKKLSHRGPDNTDYWWDADSGIFFGHTRLKIIDTTDDSNQPFSKKGAYLVYNGEVYNYISLRKKLSKSGSIFRTNGDTEVLFELLHTHGTSLLSEIDGMFSFAYYQDSVLTLAVDHFGEKPLYWYESKQGVYFSSEPKPLVEMLNVCITKDQDIASSFLLLGFVPGPSTAYNGLKKIEPATILKIENGRVSKKFSYWSIPEQFMGKGKVSKVSESVLDDISDILLHSLRRRIRADVPVGLFLSSGVDSTLIGALLKKELYNDDVHALTVSYSKGTDQDESFGATAIANYLGIRHTIIDSSLDQSDYTIERLHNIFGEPNSGITALSVQQMSFVAKKYFTVALTGTGADEIFFGYGKYKFLHKYRYILINNLISYLFSFMDIGDANFLKRFKTLASLLSVDSNDILLALKGTPFFSNKKIYPNFKGMGSNWYSDLNSKNLVKQQRDFDLKIQLPAYIIPIIERPSMSAGLEVRSPFLSKDLIEYVSNIDYRVLFKSRQKDVLRKIVERYLPLHLVDHPKKGFSVPGNALIANTDFNCEAELKHVISNWEGDKQWGKYLTRLLIKKYYFDRSGSLN